MQGMAIPNLAASAPGAPGQAAAPASLAGAIAGAPSGNPGVSNTTQTQTFPELVKQAIARGAGAVVTPSSQPTKQSPVCSASGRGKSASSKRGPSTASNGAATLESLPSTALLSIVVPSLASAPATLSVCSSAEVDTATDPTLPAATHAETSQQPASPIRSFHSAETSRSESSGAIAFPPEPIASPEPGPQQLPQSNETPAKSTAADVPSEAVVGNAAVTEARPQSAEAPVQVVERVNSEVTPSRVAGPLPPALSSIVKQVQQLQAQPSPGPASAPAPATITLSTSQQERTQRLQINARHDVEERSALLQSFQEVPAAPAVHTKPLTAPAQSASAAGASSNPASDNSSKTSSGESSSGQNENQLPTEPDHPVDPLKPAPQPPNFAQAMHSATPDPADTAVASSATSNLTLPQNHAPANPLNSSPNLPAAPPPGQSALAHLPDPAGNHFVNTAQLIENAGHSEMRIELQTDKLGNVELRARMAGDELGAAITVEKRDAHAALAVELPALQQALSGKQLRVDQVTLLQGSLNSAAGDAGRDGQQQQAPGANRFQASPSWVTAGSPALLSSLDAAPSGVFDTQGRLNVHA